MTILAAHDVFQWAAERPHLDFLIRVSYLEIYNEEIRDLLNPLARERNGALRIVDNPIAGPYVRGLTEEVVLTPTRVLEILRIGEGHRAVASTSMNARSSRSHTLFRMVVESRPAGSTGGSGDGDGEGSHGFGVNEDEDDGDDEDEDEDLYGQIGAPSPAPSRSRSLHRGTQPFRHGGGKHKGRAVRVSCLNLVDLAGSERISKSGATGVTRREGGMINTSLLTLGTVINKLITGERHIPYRDSKLTRLLSTSLGGNAKTAVVVTVSPASSNLGETKSSL